MKSSLNRRLKGLVADFGKGQVEAALANIDVARSEPSRKRGSAKTRPRKTLPGKRRAAAARRRVEQAALISPQLTASLERLATMYQERKFLTDFRDIAWFLRDHGCRVCPDSREKAFKMVMAILAGMAPAELEKTLADALERDQIGDYMMLASAIMGTSKKKSN